MMVFLDVDFWVVMLTVSHLNKKYKLQISKRDLKMNSKGSKSCNLSETASSLWKVDHKVSWKQRVRLHVQSETSASPQKWSNALKKNNKDIRRHRFHLAVFVYWMRQSEAHKV